MRYRPAAISTQRRRPRAVIEHARPLAETPRVPRVSKVELLEVEIVAELWQRVLGNVPNDVTSFRIAVRIQTRISIESGE